MKNAQEATTFDLDADITVTKAAYEYYTFPASVTYPDGNRVIALNIGMTTDDGETHAQIYSMGGKATELFAPSKDGQYVEPLVENAQVSKASDWYAVLTSLVNAGFPEPKLDELGIGDALTGLRVHVASVPRIGRDGKPIMKQSKNGKEYPSNRVEFQKVLKLPWETKGQKTSAKAPPRSAAAKPNGRESA